MYKLQVDCSKWLPVDHSETESGVDYTAKTLSRFSRCRVDIYDNHCLLKTYVNGVNRHTAKKVVAV